jgi:hypothetical protein
MATTKVDVDEFRSGVRPLAERLQELYEQIGLEMTYDPASRSLETAVNLGRRVSARVGGGVAH